MSNRARTVIVTGASSGIGRSLVEQLIQRGDNVVLAARSRAALKDVAGRLVSGPGRALVVPTDVTDRAACRQLVQRASEEFGQIDVLINNAGLAMWSRLDEVEDLSVFEQLMAVNYFGAVYCTSFALPHLKASRGVVLAVSSLTGKMGLPTRTGYAASKHALQGFFDSLRIELRESGVSVIVASPGLVATELRVRALGSSGKPVGASGRLEHADAMSAGACAARMIRAVDKRERDVVMGSGRVAQWLRLLAPSVLDRIGERAVRKESIQLAPGGTS